VTLYELTAVQILPRPRSEVFAFFADAGNLEAITPPWLGFHILTPKPIPMAAGTLLDYRIRLRGLPVRWRTRIVLWEPPDRFVDEQLRGPYRLWEHEHTFTEVETGTRVADRIRYAVPGGALIHRLLVAPDLQRIFGYRRDRMRELYGGSALLDEPVRIQRVAS